MAKPASGTALDTGSAFFTSLLAVWGLLEGTGTTSVDSAGTNTLTLNASVGWGTDQAGDTAASVTTGSSVRPLLLTTPVSLSGVVNGDQFSIAFRASLVADNLKGMVCGDNTTNNFIWLAAPLFLRDRTFHSTRNDSDFSPTSFTTMRDYLITSSTAAGTTTVRCYVDGVEDASSPLTGGKDTAFDCLMAGYDGTPSPFLMEGLLSYFYVWQGRVLTLTEAATLHSTPYTLFVGSVTLAPGSVTASWSVPSQTLLGSGTATLDPTSMTAEWSVPTQDLVEVGVIAAPAAIADWTTPAQTIVVSGSATLTSTPSIFTWVVPAQHFVGEGPNPPGSRRRAGNRAHYQVNG